ncbi:unnamed protein product [Absidia cylindrospora]
MDVATRKKMGVERQTTFGPSAPIAEWELEKATLEQDQLAFERNTTSLLKEVKLKEASWEKRRQETDSSWMNQILELQHQLEKERQDHEDDILYTKQQMEHTLQLEQKKYERRMANLHSRLEDKEKALQQYLSSTTQKPPSSTILPSPTTPSTSSNFNNLTYSSATTTTQDQQRQIQQLEQQLIKQKRRNDELERQLNHQQQPVKQSSESLSIMTWETERKELESIYNKKIQALVDLHGQEQQQLRDNFMNENSGLTMHLEARLQNVQNEYENTIKEIRDEIATEKKVWSIELQANMDQLRRQLEQHSQDQLKENERIWRDKFNDMDASLSKDDLEIKSYWQMKIDTLVENHNKERERLLGEMEVIKSRLGKDIDRRHLLQGRFGALESKYNHDRTLWIKQKQQLEELMAMKSSMEKATHEYQYAENLATSLLSALSMDEHDSSSLNNVSPSLVDLLQMSLRNATLLQTKKTDYDMVLQDTYDDTF